MSAPSFVTVTNETKSHSSRITKEGKKITYHLEVIQQPERARACGSGAKSSADRRPVDPPPIVELRVFEGGEDVTFSYNANFFLFATLENARNIAQGRVQPSQTSFPVLTGTPVAGMAYLDRPNPAGYFIFPDLSVRHEGKYRLSFSLYEELKDQKDMDTEEIKNVEIFSQTSQHVSHRLEVKSQPFTVFSAKKFPGLTESTALSRMVAEQGCRVRIRRDVRMRRRENKGKSDDWDEYEDSSEQARRHSATPDAYAQNMSAMATPQHTMDGSDRPRSVSNASVASFGMPARRTSMEQQMGQAAYPQSYSQPAPPPTSTSMYPPQFPTSQQQPQQQQYPFQQTQPPTMQPPQLPFQAPPAPTYAPPPPPQVSQNYGLIQQQQQQQPQYSQPQPSFDQQQHAHVRNSSVDFSSSPSDYRRTSMPQPPTSQPQFSSSISQPTTSAPFGQLESTYAPTTQPSYATSPTDTSYANGYNPNNSSWGSRRGTVNSSSTVMPTSQPALAPLRALSQPMNGFGNKHEPTSPSYSSPAGDAVHSPGFQDLSRPPVFNQQPPYPSQVNGKRTFSDSFDTHHMDQRLQYGARPNADHEQQMYSHMQHGYQADNSDGEDSVQMSAMSYRRADGTERRRRIPNGIEA